MIDSLEILHKILDIICKKDINNLPPDFYRNLNIVIETYLYEKKTDFLIDLLKNMNGDEIVAFIFNKGERRNRPKFFLVNDVEIDVYGTFFRRAVGFILEKNPEIKSKMSHPEIYEMIKEIFLNYLKDFFDEEKLYDIFIEEYQSKKKH